MRLFRSKGNGFYRVLLHVQNVLTLIDDKHEKIGIYITRFAQGENEETASNRAIADFEQEDKFRDISLNEVDDPPRIHVEEIVIVPKAEIGNIDTGYSMYIE